MARNDLVVFRVSEDERRQLAALAERLERNHSDTVRYLLRDAARRLLTDPTAPATPAQKKAA